MRKNILLSTLLSLAMISIASADTFYNDDQPAYSQQQYNSGLYFGLAYGATSVEDDYYEYFPDAGLSVQTNIDYDAMMFQAGYEYNPYIALEFRYWVALSDGDYSINSNLPLPTPRPGSYGDFDAFGFYLKPMYPVSKEVTVYGLLGFSSLYVEGEPGWDLLSESDFSWGLGASFNITPQFTLFADYVQLFDDRLDYYYDSTQDTTVDSINFGISYRF